MEKFLKNRVMANLFLILILILSAATLSSGSPARAAEVKMVSLGYNPKQITIHQGESIVWKNTAYTEHSAVSGDTPPLFDTGMVSPGKESKPVKFDKPGQYKYHCGLHGLSMSGVITVTAAQK